MERLLGRSKSHKHNPNRREKLAEFDLARSPTTSLNSTSWTTERVSAARLGGAAGRSANVSDSNIRPKTAGAAVSPSPLRTVANIGDPIIIMSDNMEYRFPTPTARKTTFSLVTPSATVRSDPEEIGIGVALGSPSQAHFFQKPSIALPSSSRAHQFQSPVVQAQSATTSNEMFSPAKSTPNEQREMRHDMNETGKPKLSRWRSIGNFFGKKQQQQQQDENYLQVYDANVGNSTSSSPVVRSARFSGDPPKDTMKKAKRSVRRKKEVPELQVGIPVQLPSADIGPATPPRGPLLNVNIPDIHMERYSVMFSGVLPARQSGLLARRQAGKTANLEVKRLQFTQRLMYPRTDSNQPLQIPNAPGLRRRATSPNPSPSYKLFPQGDTHTPKDLERSASVLSRPRPLRRAKTAPGGLSPKPELLEPATPATAADAEYAAAEQSRQALTPTPSEPSSPSTPKDGEAAGPRDTWRYSLTDADEPAWEMITIGKAAEPGDRVSASDVARPLARAPGPSRFAAAAAAAPDRDDDWLYRAEVQVARSLSVTKARRHLLRPLAVAKEQGAEKVSDSRALTPLLVEAAARKSMAVRIEDA